MKFTIQWCEHKQTSNGAKKLDASVKDEQGIETTGVTLWEKSWATANPTFAELTPGATIEGDLVVSQNGQYTNKTLYPKKVPAKTGFGGGIKAAQERKAEMIEKAQERKSESIAYFNSVNSAIQLLTHRGLTEMEDENIKTALIFWRNWFLEEFQKYEKADYQDKHKPF